MREKVTASLIFKDRKSSYPRSISHPFLGDYVRLRQNPQWKKICSETNDQYVVFADIINKITRSGGKFVPILFVISTSSMLILDQRTMQIKYRVPAAEILRLSLSPYFDDIAVFHVRATSPTRELRSQANIPGCLSSEAVKRKGDFVFQTGHVIEIVTKLFLVIQNATGKPPQVNISTEFEANFGSHNVTFAFKATGNQDVAPGHVKLVKRGNTMEVIL
jgi:myosin-1